MIEGQVAAIINARELAINRGSDHGVEEGMQFEVLEPDGVAITDPETDAHLGSVTQIKIRVRVTEVEDKWSLAETFEMFGGSGTLSWAALVAGTGGYRAPRVRTLKTDEATIDPLSEAESYVKRGDPVRQIVDEDDGEIAATIIVKPDGTSV